MVLTLRLPFCVLETLFGISCIQKNKQKNPIKIQCQSYIFGDKYCRLFLKDFVGMKRVLCILYHPARLTSCNLPLNIFVHSQTFLFLTKLPPFYLFFTFSPPNSLPSQPLQTVQSSSYLLYKFFTVFPGKILILSIKFFKLLPSKIKGSVN